MRELLEKTVKFYNSEKKFGFTNDDYYFNDRGYSPDFLIGSEGVTFGGLGGPERTPKAGEKILCEVYRKGRRESLSPWIFADNPQVAKFEERKKKNLKGIWIDNGGYIQIRVEDGLSSKTMEVYNWQSFSINRNLPENQKIKQLLVDAKQEVVEKILEKVAEKKAEFEKEKRDFEWGMKNFKASKDLFELKLENGKEIVILIIDDKKFEKSEFGPSGLWKGEFYYSAGKIGDYKREDLTCNSFLKFVIDLESFYDASILFKENFLSRCEEHLERMYVKNLRDLENLENYIKEIRM